MDSQPRVDFDGICAFYFIEEQTIARRVVVTKMVITEIDQIQTYSAV